MRNSVDAYRTQELKHFDKSKLSGIGSRESTKQESTKLGSSLMDRNLPLFTYDTGRLSVNIDTPELRTHTRGLRQMSNLEKDTFDVNVPPQTSRRKYFKNRPNITQTNQENLSENSDLRVKFKNQSKLIVGDVVIDDHDILYFRMQQNTQNWASPQTKQFNKKK